MRGGFVTDTERARATNKNTNDMISYKKIANMPNDNLVLMSDNNLYETPGIVAYINRQITTTGGMEDLVLPTRAAVTPEDLVKLGINVPRRVTRTGNARPAQQMSNEQNTNELINACADINNDMFAPVDRSPENMRRWSNVQLFQCLQTGVNSSGNNIPQDTLTRIRNLEQFHPVVNGTRSVEPIFDFDAADNVINWDAPPATGGKYKSRRKRKTKIKTHTHRRRRSSSRRRRDTQKRRHRK